MIIMDKIFFIFSNTLFLFIFLMSCLGFGYRVIKNNSKKIPTDLWINICLSLCLGIGIFIVVLQLLGIFGYINQSSVIGLVVLGLLFSPSALHALAKNHLSSFLVASDIKYRPLIYTVLILGSLVLITKILSPPKAWDEVMYHLPHARDWVSTGYITINQWLRYPYSPFNFQLLYAACLTLPNDVLTHMIHAITGILTVIGTYRVAMIYFNRTIALLAVIILFFSINPLMGKAYIDLGLMCFIFFAFYCFYVGCVYQYRKFFYIGAFLLGLAVGMKYQALIFIPPFFVILLLKERSIVSFLKVGFWFLLPCLYWYLRNVVLVGNPVEPLASSIFGYHSWNEADMQYQLADLQNAADWPAPVFGLAIVTLFLFRKLPRIGKWMVIFSSYAFIVWYVTSHYARYLMPVYPFLAILSAVSIDYSMQKLHVHFPKLLRWITAQWSKNQVGLITTLSTVITLAMLVAFVENWQRIKVSETERYQFLKNKIYAYDVALYLKNHPEYKVVQFALEDTLYYLPSGTIGDHFGPGRYRDFQNLEPSLLAKKIKEFHANALLLSDKRGGDEIYSKPNFNHYFALVVQIEDGRLYRLK